jgi:hypothetical protein
MYLSAKAAPMGIMFDTGIKVTKKKSTAKPICFECLFNLKAKITVTVKTTAANKTLLSKPVDPSNARLTVSFKGSNNTPK